MSVNYRTLFCDDIRPEVSGKESYIGVFDDNISINVLPAVLPKLVGVILFEATAGTKKLQETVTFKLNGKVLHTVPVEVENKFVNVEKKWKGRLNFAFSPFVIHKEGTLEIYVGEKNEKLIGALYISLDDSLT